MATYSGVILSNDIMPLQKDNGIKKVTIVRVVPHVLTRKSNTMSIRIMPLLPDAIEGGLVKERKTYDAILISGDTQLPPRRSPLETSWTRKRS